MLVNIYPKDTIAKYLLSSYLLKGYINRYYEESDLSINILNFNEVATTSELLDNVRRDNPDIIGYSCYVWNIEKILTVIQSLKDKMHAIHILGGPEISFKRILTFAPPFIGDYYIIGEGERVFLNLIKYLKTNINNNLNVNLPHGVATWVSDKLVYRENTDRIENLDEIPSVYLNGIIEERLYARQQAFIETQRGCLFKCKYCVYHKGLPTISYYSLDRVYDEFDNLIAKKTLSALRIFDAIFTSNINRAKNIVKHLIELKNSQKILLPNIYWEMTYDTVDEELVSLIASLRYRETISNINDIKLKNRPQLYSDMVKDYTAINCIGIQSFNGPSLKAVGRKIMNVVRFNNFMNMINRYNLVLKIDIILGLPYETFETYFNGLEILLPYLKNTDHILNIHRLQMLPGSELEELCDDYGLQYSEIAPRMVFATKHFSELELSYASKLTAILFRVVNSPLRTMFFHIKDISGRSCFEIIREIYNEIIGSEKFRKTKFINTDLLDDDYWNNNIYSEIPSEWLMDSLKKN